jgi:twinkle protein
VAQVCTMLLPKGRQDGAVYRCGDAHGTEGQSLVVNLSGPRAGLWTDFAQEGDEHGGDLIKLWMIARGKNFRDALADIAQAFSIPDEEAGWKREGMGGAKPKRDELACLPARLRPVVEGGAVWKWLTETRKLTGEAIRKYRIGEHTGKWRDDKEHTWVVFPFYDPDDKLVLLKYRDIENKGNMWTWPKQEDGGKTILFGLQALRAEGGKEGEKRTWPNDLLVTEGELDAMALAVWGYAAVSLPYGAQGKKAENAEAGISRAHEKWIENLFDWLNGFETIYLAGDCDGAGRAAWTGIPARLGEFKIRYVTWPNGHKDANDCLKFGVTEREIYAAIRDATSMDPPELVRAGQFREEIFKEFYPTEEMIGDPLPWTFPMAFRPQEVTCWHGWNESGKTQALNNCIVHWAMKQRRRACVASLEWQAPKTWKNLGRIAMGKRKPADEAEFDRMIRWIHEWFLVYSKVGEADLDDVLRVFAYAAQRYGCFHFVVDALLRVKNVAIDDLNAQRQAVNKVIDFAMRHNVHVHLVAHAKKPDSRHPADRCWPSRFDIAGSGDIANLVQNVICIWRNAGKEERVAAALELPDGDEDRKKTLDTEYWREDTLLIVQKQRMTGREGHKRLWFDKDEQGGSFQFREAVQDMPSVRLMEE